MNESTMVWLMLILVLVVAFVVPQLMVRRAVPEVVRIFREHGATDPEHARLAAELGLGEKTMWERALRRRDFKPKALLAMIRVGLVHQTDGGRVYLSEKALAETIWRDA